MSVIDKHVLPPVPSTPGTGQALLSAIYPWYRPGPSLCFFFPDLFHEISIQHRSSARVDIFIWNQLIQTKIRAVLMSKYTYDHILLGSTQYYYYQGNDYSNDKHMGREYFYPWSIASVSFPASQVFFVFFYLSISKYSKYSNIFAHTVGRHPKAATKFQENSKVKVNDLQNFSSSLESIVWHVSENG